MRIYNYCLFIASFTLLLGQGVSFGQDAMFEPKDGKAIMIMGQDLGAVGGFPKPNNDGYIDHIDIMPGGVTSYTSIPALNGLKELTNYGAGDVNAQAIVDNKKFDESVLVFGLSMVNQLKSIANGSHDEKIKELAMWIKEQERPVFLRIGYEFDGEWNRYEPELFVRTYRRIVNIFRNNYVENCATVWQSTGRFDSTFLLKYYPGDEYVDWVGYSHFGNLGQSMIDIGRAHNKPCMIAESTPIHLRTPGDDKHGEEVWNAWFVPFFEHVHKNSDVIKAVAYINANWDVQPMWAGQDWGDSRVQSNTYIKKKWLEEITNGFWLNASPELFDTLRNNDAQ